MVAPRKSGVASRIANLRLLLLLGLSVTALAVAACGGSDNSSSSSGSSSAASGDDSAGNSQVAAAEQAYKAQMGEAQWKAPGPPFDASKASGKSVYYIGVDMSIPILQTIAGQLKDALATAGAKLVVCDGKGQPTEWKSCADNAVARKAGAIIVESFPAELIAGSLANAKKAGIPVIDGNNPDPTDPQPDGLDPVELRSYGGCKSGPAIFVKPGDTLRVDLINQLAKDDPSCLPNPPEGLGLPALVGCFNTTTTAVAIALRRLTTAGTQGTGQSELYMDDSTAVANATAVDVHSVGPTITAGNLRAGSIGASIGSGVIWTFGDRGLAIPAGTANGVGIVPLTGTGQICDVYFEWSD